MQRDQGGADLLPTGMMTAILQHAPRQSSSKSSALAESSGLNIFVLPVVYMLLQKATPLFRSSSVFAEISTTTGLRPPIFRKHWIQNVHLPPTMATNRYPSLRGISSISSGL